MELDASALNSRRATGVPLCLSKSQKEALAPAPGKNANGASSPSHRAPRHLSAQTNVELPADVDRALQMFRTYPVMRVAGTAFENYLNKADHRVSGSLSGTNMSLASAGNSGTDGLNARQRGGSCQVLQDAVDSSVSHLDADKGAVPRRNSGEGMVRLAAAVKRAAMWQTAVVAALAGYRMSDEYREMRLRKALEKHMLPVLVKRREETGSVMDTEKVKLMTKRTQAQKQEASSAPQGSYLKEHCPLFAKFGNSQLLQLIAEKMERVRYIAGEVITEADQPCQHRLYVLVSGKCEVRVGTRNEQGTLSMTKSLIQSGSTFGGVFGTHALFTGTYKAVSQCIVWVLDRTAFESVFTNFADAAMMEAFCAALRAHGEEWLQHRYPLRPTWLQRVPLYRRLPAPPAKYLPDFSPVVKIRGERLFDQDDNPGDVYVLVEGTVKRTVRGDDGTFSSGTAQLLAPTSFATFNASGRFLLLGEEPHILPGFQRYRCVAQSRVALFYRVSGERFVNALLDDPNGLCEMREKLAQLYTLNMSLDASCLSFAPLFRHFPSSALQRLAIEAKPAVIGRSVSVCEPAQTIKDVFLVTVGEVRDPRTYGHSATCPLPTPPPSEGDSTEEDENDPKGRHGRRDKKTDRHAKGNATTTASSAAAPKARAEAKNTVSSPSRRASHNPPNANNAQARSMAPPRATDEQAFTFADDVAASYSTAAPGIDADARSRASATVVSAVDEQDEFNPPLPKQASKRFLATLGGGWEGLLTDKWPNGWATTTTTEVWAIPTLSIRTEYNNAGRATQNAILTAARQTQKAEQGLTTLPSAKLPPMSVYLPEQVTTKATIAAAAAAAVLASGAASKRHTKPSTTGSRASGRVTAGSGGLENSTSVLDPGAAGTSALPDIYSVNYVSQSASTRHAPRRRASPFASTAGQPQLPQRTSPRPDRKSKAAATTNRRGEPLSKSSAAATPAQKTAAAAPPLVSLNPKQAASLAQARAKAHRAKAQKEGASQTSAPGADTPAEEAGSAASAHLLAVYRGEFADGDPALLNVVRDPVPVRARAHREAAAREAGTEGALTAAQRADAWPTSTSPQQTRWFQEVPSYEPLPGTINNRGLTVAAPEFAQNTTFMTTRHGKHYQDTLSAQEQYFSSTLTRGDRAPAAAGTGGASPPPPLQPRPDVPKRHAVKDLM